MSHETGRSTTADPSTVTERDQFADFLEVVLGDFTFSGHREWENNTLERFLGALAAYSEARVIGMKDQDMPAWRLFAEMIVAATGYE
jgi:hypothetical protein